MKQTYRFLIIVFAAMILQGAGHYFSHKMVAFRYLHWGWIMVRIVIPVILLAAIGIPFKRLGLGLPKLDQTARRILPVNGAIVKPQPFRPR